MIKEDKWTGCDTWYITTNFKIRSEKILPEDSTTCGLMKMIIWIFKFLVKFDYSEISQPDTKGHMLYDSIYMKYSG